MSKPLPDFADLWRWAEAGYTITGTVPLARMPRLVSLLDSDTGVVRADLQFGREGALRYVRGTVDAEPAMRCQRCLEPIALPLHVDIALGMVQHEDQAGRLPAGFEPVLVTDQPVRLAELLEDEIILALPVVATHPPGVCGEAAGRDEGSTPSAKKNPFAVLSVLKNKGA